MPLRAKSSPIAFLIALCVLVLAALAQNARTVGAESQHPAPPASILPSVPQGANPPGWARPFDPFHPFASLGGKSISRKSVTKNIAKGGVAQGVLPTFGALTNPIFQVASTFSQGYLAGGLASADFNSDGKNDLAVLNDCVDSSYPCTKVGSVTIELGNGDGTFTPGATYQVQTNPAWVVTGDFNGDGKADLAVTNDCLDTNCSASVSILLGNGDGTFTVLTPMAAGYLADGMAVGDFNHDGHLDLAVVDITATPSCCRGALLVFLGNGDGTFQSPVSYTLEDSPQTIVAADFNGDGNLDLAVTNACLDSQACTRSSTNGVVYVFFGDGTGSFSLPSLVYTPLAVDYIATGDFNGDGAPDLVVQNLCASFTSNACYQHETNTILMNDGHGNFSVGASLPAGPQPSGLTVADLNHDGKGDVISTNSLHNTTSVFLSNGEGTFVPGVPYLSGPISGFVLSGDWNGDGKTDFAVAHYCGDLRCSDRTGSVSLLLGNGDGSLQAALNYASGGLYAFSVAVGDVNGDGKPDLLAANYCADANDYCNLVGSVGVLLGNGDGTFQTAVSYGSGGSYAYSVAVGDLNGDGKPDLLVANQCASSSCNNGVGSVGVLLGNGDGTFQVAQSYGTGDALSVAVGDVNGDGKPDVLVANYCATSNSCNGGTVSVLLGNGDGTLQSAVSYGSGGVYAYSVAVVDVNGDGKPDLLVANECATSNCNGSTVGVLLGNGDGTFQAAQSYDSGGAYARSVAAGDVNGDGKPDLLVAHYCGSNSNCSAGSLGVLLGNGDGTFQVAVNYDSGGAAAFSAAVGDVNGDGKPDLLVANQCVNSNNCNGGTVGVLLGNGDGTFQLAQSYSLFYGTQSIALGDLNRDGRLDAAVAISGNSSVSILRNMFSAPAATGVNLTSSLAAVAFQPVTFTATITSTLAGVPTGSVSFTDNGSPIGSGTVNASGQAVLTTSDLGAGSHFIVGYYSGDYSYAPSNSYGAGLKVTQGTAATSVGSSLNPSVYGQSVTLSANVTSTYGAPTGTVAFSSGATTLGTAALTAGVAHLNYSALPVGSDPVTASYGGDTNFTGSNSAALLQAVTSAGSTLTLGSNLNPSVYGQTVSFTATAIPLYGGVATGMVTFKDGAASIGTAAISGNAATFTINTLGVSPHTITATYGGDVNVTASNSGPVAQNVTQATTAATLASTVNPALVNESITFTATVVGQYGGTATGSVIFKAGTTKLGTITLSANQASVTTSFSTTGTRSITAQYVGDINNIGSASSALDQSVVAKFTTATVLASSLNPSYVNQPVTFTATVSSASGAIPNGEVVTFTNGGARLGTGTTSGGVATLTTPSLTVASHSIKASYAGDSTFATGTSAAVTQVVSLYPTSTTLAVSPNPSAYGQSVTLKATVTSSAPAGPTGTVTFKNGSTTIGTAALNAGTATLATTKLPVGSDAITATYNGDAQNAKGTSSPFTATVNQAVSATSLTSSLNPSKSGQSVKFTATVTSPTTTPVGSVSFMDGSTTLATVSLGSGKASYSTSALGTGTHNISAVYGGTANITGSTSPTLVQTVN